MSGVFSMWKYSRMIVLTALGAALYATGIALLTFPPPVSLIPLAQLFPLPLSLMFGPAAAWSLAIGATIGGILTGDFSIGNVFGFFGNFALGFLPYILWTRLKPLASGNRELEFSNWKNWALYALVAIGASFSTAIIISWPSHLLSLVPFSFLVNLIGVQDTIMGFITIFLVLLVYKRVESMGLVYWEVMPAEDLDKPGSATSVFGAWLIIISSVVTWLLGAFILPDAASIIGGIGTALIIAGIILCHK